MAMFLLIHGAWQGAWCWREIVLRLEACGHHAVAIDLPGHGQDATPVESLALRDYVQRIVGAVEAMGEPPLLVGHSMGAPISEAAETVPERLRGLVYISALLPQDGASMMQMVEKFDPEYLAEIVWGENGRTAMLSARGATQFLYSLCPPEFVKDAIARFTHEPVRPFEEVIHITPGRFGTVPRYYIECTQDRVVPIELQRQMRTMLPCHQVHTIDTGHSPFFSTPDDLVKVLDQIATYPA